MLPFIVCGGAGQVSRRAPGCRKPEPCRRHDSGIAGPAAGAGPSIGRCRRRTGIPAGRWADAEPRYSPQGKRTGKPGARSFQKGFFGGKVCGRPPSQPLPSPAGRQGQGKFQSRLFLRAEHPPDKGRPVSTASSFWTRSNLTRSQPISVQHPLPPPVCICGAWDSPAQECAFLGNVCKLHLSDLEV